MVELISSAYGGANFKNKITVIDLYQSPQHIFEQTITFAFCNKTFLELFKSQQNFREFKEFNKTLSPSYIIRIEILPKGSCHGLGHSAIIKGMVSSCLLGVTRPVKAT